MGFHHQFVGINVGNISPSDRIQQKKKKKINDYKFLGKKNAAVKVLFIGNGGQSARAVLSSIT